MPSGSDPSRPLFISVLAPAPLLPPLVGLALHGPAPVIAVASLLANADLSVHLTLWFTVFQPDVARARNHG